MEKKRLAIFDMDGTLFDTKDVNYQAYKEAMIQCGFKTELNYEYFCEHCNGNHYQKFLPVILPGISSEQVGRIHDYKKEIYVQHLDAAKVHKHLFSIIDSIRNHYYIALATTASRKNTEDILNYFEVSDKFDLLVTQEDVSETKPSPECFTLAMKLAGVNVADTLIFEDSKEGIQAAQASGACYLSVYW